MRRARCSPPPASSGTLRHVESSSSYVRTGSEGDRCRARSSSVRTELSVEDSDGKGDRPLPPGVPGPTEQEFVAFAYRYALRIRAMALCSVAFFSVLAMPWNEMTATAGIAALCVVWSLGHLRLALVKPRSGPLLAIDLLVITAVCLSQELTVPECQPMHGNTWVLVAVSVVVVTYQLTHPTLSGLAVAVYLMGADLAGVMLDRSEDWTLALPNVTWLLVQATLAQIIYRVLRSRSRSADVAEAAAASIRRQFKVSEACRAAELNHLATLHDTACATLLMVSTGGHSIRPQLLRAQAAEDLDRLRGQQTTDHDTDLTAELTAEVARYSALVEVRTQLAPGLGTVSGTVAAALCGALGEALRNVCRHAGVDTATVLAHREGQRVVVMVRDAGSGFDPAKVPEHRQGLTRSVTRRMAVVGGRAVVESAPGRGTEVRLEWAPCLRT